MNNGEKLSKTTHVTYGMFFFIEINQTSRVFNRDLQSCVGQEMEAATEDTRQSQCTAESVWTGTGSGTRGELQKESVTTTTAGTDQHTFTCYRAAPKSNN